MMCLALALGGAGALATPAAADFPAEDQVYHTYAEVGDETLSIAAAYPSLVRRISLGQSSERREIWALKVSDNAAADESEPEVLFASGQHAREHLTVEMAMYLLNELTSKYATDARIRNVVDTREIWIIPSVNPDGAEYDVATGRYVFWRKNRQPNPPSPDIGTDLNRNWGWQWGCCEGSGTTPASDTYRGAFAFSAPETKALRDFVLSRRVGGVQQIKTSIDFHSYGELVMWPFAYTAADTAPGMTQDQRNAFAALGQSMAQSNGYKPQQTSDLYISDGNLRDWFWGQEGIFAYGFEMWGGQYGFYPPDEFIPAQTSRNREAALRLIEAAACPYRASGLETRYCGIARRSLSPSGTDFGARAVDDGPSAPQVIALTNVSPTPLKVVSATVAGASAAEFVEASDGCSGATLAPAASCSVGVAFDPASVGAKTAQLTFSDDSGAGAATLAGTGEGASGAAPPPPPPDLSAGGGGATDSGERATAAILVTRAGLDAGGHVRLRVLCTTFVATSCRGVLKLATRLPGGRKVVTIAKANYVVAAGTSTIKLRLGPKSRRALRRRAAFTVTATITSQQEATGAITTAAKRVRLVRKPAR